VKFAREGVWRDKHSGLDLHADRYKRGKEKKLRGNEGEGETRNAQGGGE